MMKERRGCTGFRVLRALSFLLVTFGFSLFLATSASFAERSSRSGPTGQLEIIALPDGAKVRVDGELVGESPLPAVLDLPLGEHRVLVHKRGFARHSEDVVVSAGRTTTVEAYLPPISGVLQVTANVRDADVSLDGESLGSPPIDLEVEPGEQLLRVTAPGYEDFSRTIAVVAGESIVIEAVLGERRGSINRGWFWGTGALSLLLFVTGGITGGAALATAAEFNDTRSRYEAGDTTAVYEGNLLAEEYDRYRVATTVLLITGAALAVAAFVLAVLSWRRRDRTEEPRSLRLSRMTAGELPVPSEITLAGARGGF